MTAPFPLPRCRSNSQVPGTHPRFARRGLGEICAHLTRFRGPLGENPDFFSGGRFAGWPALFPERALIRFDAPTASARKFGRLEHAPPREISPPAGRNDRGAGGAESKGARTLVHLFRVGSDLKNRTASRAAHYANYRWVSLIFGAGNPSLQLVWDLGPQFAVRK